MSVPSMPVPEPRLRRLSIQELSLPVRLGCTAEERAIPQEVRISLELAFAHGQRGEESDSLVDVICYAEICQWLRSFLAEQEFALVEKLANDCYRLIGQRLDGCALLKVRVHKVRPPIEGLLGGVVYKYGDEF